MIFSGPLYGKVLRGDKTMTRRLVQANDLETKYRVGARKAVQKGRGVHGEAHLILTGVRRETLGEITFEDARAEGFRTTNDFKDYWIWLHDKKWAERMEDECCAIYTESPEDTKSPSDLMAMRVNARFDARWAHKEAWVLTFELDRTEHLRLLADRNARADYVESPSLAMSGSADPGEAVDAATQARFSREGHQGFVARERARELDRELLAAEDRMRLVRFEAKAKGVDVDDQVRWIESRIKQMEKKVHRGRGKAA